MKTPVEMSSRRPTIDFYAVRPFERRFDTFRHRWGSPMHKKLMAEKRAYEDLCSAHRARFRAFLKEHKVTQCNSGGWGFRRKEDAERVRDLFEKATGIRFDVVIHWYL
jgi:hypothetical protein